MHLSFLFAVFLNAIAVNIFDRIDWLKKRPVVIGVLFGILAELANILRIEIEAPKVFLSMIDIPVMTAGFFYGTVPGLVAGGVASLFRLASQLHADTCYWLTASITTMLIAVYSILTSKCFLRGKRPNLTIGILCMLFGECLRFILFCLTSTFFGGDAFLLMISPDATSEYYCAVAIAGMLTVIAAKSWGTLRSNLLNKTLAVFLLFDLGYAVVFVLSAYFAHDDTMRTLWNGGIALHNNFLSQVRYMLRDSTVFFVDSEPEMRHYTHEQVVKLAKESGYDEINIYDNKGKLVESNSDAVLKADRRLDFHPLYEGPLCKTPIMETGFYAGYLLHPDNIFRIATPFPDGSGYFEIGMQEGLMYADYEIMLIPLLKDRSFGDTGFFVIANKSGRIVIPVFQQPELLGENIRNFGITEQHLALEDYECFTLLFNKKWCIGYQFADALGDKTFVFLPLSEVYSSYLSQGCITCLLLLILLFLTKIVLNSIRSAQKKIAAVQQAKFNMEKKNLELARRIQQNDLRNDPLNNDKCRIIAEMHPAREVGGDTYDYFELPDGKIVFGISDVSGKGVSAAFFMMKTTTSIRLLRIQGHGLVTLMDETNEVLCRNNDSMMFVTSWGGLYDPETQELEYVCAGHNPPIIVRANGTVQILDCKRALPLGIHQKYHYHSQKIRMEHGDRIFLYTDGVTEAMNGDHQLFGEERLLKLLRKGCKSKNFTLIDMVFHAVKKFAGTVEQSDDITMLSMLIK